MNIHEFTDYLLSRMERAKLASGGTVINCRCPECGDSIHKTSAHFYISVPDDKNPIFYYCHKCNSGGIINFKKLIEWNIYSPEAAQFVHDYAILTSGSRNFKKYHNQTIYNVRHTITTMDNKSEFKRNYVCSRVGVNLSYEELANLKIVLNLDDLLRENNIKRLTRDANIVQQLSQEFIGFLSIDNAFLNMRRTCDEGIVYEGIDKRYINYSLMNKKDTNQRFYTIPTQVNLNTPERIKIHISEGPFDILSVYLNLRNREPGIYTSVAGNNYLSVILYFLAELRLPYTELHFYPDNDRYGTVDRINKIIAGIPDKTIPVYIHTNKMNGEKDFGVPLSRIKESINRIR